MIQGTTIQHGPEDVHKIFMVNDLARWKEEIEIINVEMIFYRNLINAHLKDLATWNVTDYQNLFNGIAEIQHFNEVYQKQYYDFSNKLDGINECDSIQCEAYFVDDHTNFKASIEGHFSNYKSFKKNIFTYLRTKYNY